MKSLSLDDRRLLLGGAAVLALVVVALTWFVLVGPQRGLAEEYDSQRADVEMKNASLQRENASLDQQRERLPELRAALEAAREGLPTTTALPQLTRQLAADAKAAGVTLDNVAITPPTPVGGAPTGATEAESATTSEAAGSAGPAQQAISVTLTSTGGLTKQQAFLDRLQDGSRRMLVGSSQLTAVGDAGQASVARSSSMLTQVTVFSIS